MITTPQNYDRQMDELISSLSYTPTLLLHSCCAPCSTSVITKLSEFFAITVFYYNPNIDDKEEYTLRSREQERLIREMKTPNPVLFLEGEYNPRDFLDHATPLSKEAEGGARCTFCYSLRLEKTAQKAKEQTFEFFATTLSVSPLKDAHKLNTIGLALEKKYDIRWLVSDFKKKDGYRKSVELSKKYGLYRQNYCGCSFSKKEALQRTQEPRQDFQKQHSPQEVHLDQSSKQA